MRGSLLSRGRRGGALTLLLSLALLLTVALFTACLTSVEGERSSSGECPSGETCSEATPQGLTFVGHAFFDDQRLRLGPVLAGGAFELGLRTTDGQALPDFAYATDDGSVLSAAAGEGPFGPTDAEGEPLLSVAAHLRLKGASPGSAYVRITDPDTGELYDRLELEVYAIRDIRVTNVEDPGREYLHAGCEEMLGVRLLADDGETELRAFDQDIALRADGEVRSEPNFWDCFFLDVPADVDEVTVEVDAAGQTFTRALAVRTLEDAGLSECPAVQRD